MIRSLLHYSRFANGAYIHALESNEVEDENSIVLMSHVLNAQHIWNARIRNRKPEFSTWDTHTYLEMKRLNELGYENSVEIMASLNPTTPINYQNQKGHNFTKTVQDVMLHIANHSTYHRGQVAMRLKELGLQPPASDYIFYSNEI